MVTVDNADCANKPGVICGKYKTGRVCKGDSGGALVADRDGNGAWVQYGIMSYIRAYVRGPIFGVSSLFVARP